MDDTAPAILLVEDSEADRELTLRELRRHGVTHEVSVVTTGLEALEFLFGQAAGEATPRPLPLVVLLDLRLPLIDGVEVLRRVRADARTMALPMIVVTGSEADVDAMQCFALRADAVLTKPLAFADFERTLRHLGLRSALQIRTAPPRASVGRSRMLL